MTCWVYVQSEPGLFTVGFYDPEGKWHSDSDHDNRADARRWVAYLNGSNPDNFSDSYETYKHIKERA